MAKWRVAAILSGALLAADARAEALRMLLTQIPGIIEQAPDGASMRGVGIDLMKEVGRRAGVELRFEAYPQARARLLVERQRDACLPVAHLPEQAANFKWSAPLLQMRLVLLARGDDGRQLRSLEQAGGLRVGAMRGTMAAARLKERGVAVEESADYLSGLEKLRLGRLDLWAMLDVGVASLARRLEMPPPRVAWVMDTLDVSFACNRQVDDALIARLDGAIAAMRADGSMARFDLR
ncbi:substrate-binding periplasmic protein [Chromobacterium violaceum]|uniref:Solute-binding protein family 3/N-terminal domain-containing protein n=3 Tax=Chromobacterium violaceum TaxID=536 RepID=Q7NXF5_CHRVO|nr:transporter substrate-binding domain-containing protein [Chromobacterium violaceum]AAQ59347.1 conserved hypothetical protein [Chromobacterium violaceum ATCC 12472]KJH68663.1 hypothetical protein UF16_03300 [Chromobacterium violaceum]MBA8735192.1 transporter substrate-binding domain-containing protein [Chromobacterium violaceum]OQS12047.1 hypothetical protein B0T38_00695 [Chromobacterium violaceum]OQS28516.1 hypothetical protein B0T37_06595 [Chromobacterium violaceum]